MNLSIAEKYISNHNEKDFNKIAIHLFQYHFIYNPIYSTFCKALGLAPESVITPEQIPFLPISLFKTQKILLSNTDAPVLFESSGTSATEKSKHYIAYPKLYVKSFMQNYFALFGNPKNSVILSLLPSYLERNNSSLVYMANHLIQESGHQHSGFYLYNFDTLHEKLKLLRKEGIKTILIGVSFALLDFLECKSISFPELIIIETGGMKGRRHEMTRKELHERLKKGFGVSAVYSEYGMTELLSQAYSKADGIFVCPPWMKVFIRDKNDPLKIVENEKTGGINVIDLANSFSCPFIATDDLGKTHTDGTFEVLGRIDASDIRGCNTMIL